MVKEKKTMDSNSIRKRIADLKIRVALVNVIAPKSPKS
jgi:hypothetical protein